MLRAKITNLIAMGSGGVYEFSLLENRIKYSQTLIYIIMTNNTLTAGARAAKGTIENPAARTAMACISPAKTRTLSGISSITGFPISKTQKKNQSVMVSNNTMVRRNHVWWDGNR